MVDTMPESPLTDMDGLPVDLERSAEEAHVSLWDRAWGWLLGLVVRGMNPPGDRMVA